MEVGHGWRWGTDEGVDADNVAVSVRANEVLRAGEREGALEERVEDLKERVEVLDPRGHVDAIRGKLGVEISSAESRSALRWCLQ